MPYFRLILLAYAALVVETSVWQKGDRSNLPERPAGCFAQIGPVPFLPLVVVAAVLTIDGWPAIVFSAGVGLLADCLSPGRLGVEMFCAAWVALVIQQLGKKGTDPICRHGPQGASHKLDLSPFSRPFVLTALSFFAVFVIECSSVVIRHVFAGVPMAFAEIVSAAAWVAASSALLCLAAILAWRSLSRLTIGH